MKEEIFVLRDNEILTNFMNSVADKVGGEDIYEVALKPFKSQRSVQQNRLYWMWVGILAQETGASKNHMHEFLKSKFLDETLARILG